MQNSEIGRAKNRVTLPLLVVCWHGSALRDDTKGEKRVRERGQQSESESEGQWDIRHNQHMFCITPTLSLLAHNTPTTNTTHLQNSCNHTAGTSASQHARAQMMFVKG